MATPVSCLAIGDLHFTVSNIAQAKELITKIDKLVKQVAPTFIVLLGDTLHTHEKIHIAPLKMATKFITLLASKLPVYIIIGNHDYINNSQFLTDNHSFNSFKKIKNVVVCDKPKDKTIGGHHFVFCPYVAPGRFEEALTTTLGDSDWKSASCIFAHQEFYGCQLNPVVNSLDGDVWPEEYPTVVSGHIHDEQRLSENIYYPGSCMQCSFGEKETKIVALLTFDPFTIQRVNLEMKRKKIVYLDIDKANAYHAPENAIVKLVVKGQPDQFKVFRGCPDYKRLIEEGVIVSFSPVRCEEHETTPVAQKNFMVIFSDMIEEEKDSRIKGYVKEAFDNLLTAD